MPIERYIFYKREQGPEESFEQYYTELRRLAQKCAFDSSTPDEVLRDRVVFGIRDSSVRERLFGLTDLTLEKTEEICRRADRTEFQMRAMTENTTGDAIHAMMHKDKRSQRHQQDC